MHRLVPVLAILAACGKDDSDVVYEPTVSFLAPTAGGTVAAGDVQVSIVTEDFELVAPEAASRAVPVPLPLRLLVAEAEAHNEEGKPKGYCALTLDNVAVTDLSEPQFTIPDVAAGAHTLACQLYFEDGDPIEPTVGATVDFTAQ